MLNNGPRNNWKTNQEKLKNRNFLKTKLQYKLFHVAKVKFQYVNSKKIVRPSFLDNSFLSGKNFFTNLEFLRNMKLRRNLTHFHVLLKCVIALNDWVCQNSYFLSLDNLRN